MEVQSQPKIIFAERLNHGMVVTFEDGRNIFYSAELLNETAAQARDITALSDDDLI